MIVTRIVEVMVLAVVTVGSGRMRGILGTSWQDREVARSLVAFLAAVKQIVRFYCYFLLLGYHYIVTFVTLLPVTVIILHCQLFGEQNIKMFT